MELRGQRVLITGGTSGVGRALVDQLVATGCRVATCGRDAERLASVAAAHPGVFTVAIDLSANESPRTLVERVVREFGGLEIVINNAAVQEHDEFTADPDGIDGRIERELAINVRAPMQIAAAALPWLGMGPKGAIVNVTSGLALAPKKSGPVYCASKAALRSFSRSLRYQTEDAGGRVVVIDAVLPLVDTPMTAGREGAAKKVSPESVAAEILKGLQTERAEIRIGKVSLLAVVLRISSRLGHRIMRD